MIGHTRGGVEGAKRETYHSSNFSILAGRLNIKSIFCPLSSREQKRGAVIVVRGWQRDSRVVETNNDELMMDFNSREVLFVCH